MLSNRDFINNHSYSIYNDYDDYYDVNQVLHIVIYTETIDYNKYCVYASKKDCMLLSVTWNDKKFKKDKKEKLKRDKIDDIKFITSIIVFLSLFIAFCIKTGVFTKW